MNFQKIVEQILDENVAQRGDDKKKGIIAGSLTTNTGRYASAHVGTSAGVIVPQTTPVEKTKGHHKSFAEHTNTKADDDTTVTKKCNVIKTDSHKNSFKQCRGHSREGRSGKSGKSSSEGNKGTIIKYKSVNFGGEWKWS